MPASEPAAAAGTWFSSQTISKLWSLVAFIVFAASAMTVFRPLAIALTRWCDQKPQYNAQSLAYTKEPLINLRIVAHCGFDSRARVWTGN